jgi:hypothetical protein
MIEEQRASDGVPFNGDLRMPVDFASPQDRLRTLGVDFVIRLVHSVLSETARLSHCLTLFGELVGFGVNAPPIWAVVGRGVDDSSGAFVVTRRVAGRPLADALRSSAETASAATEELCIALAGYDAHKFSVGGDYLVDMKIENFVFGTLPRRSEPAVYWIDHDPVWATFDPRSATPTTIAQTHWHIAEVTNLVIHGEVFGGTRFAAARAKLEPLFDLMSENERGAGRVAALRRGLDAGEPVDGRLWVEAEHAAASPAT